MAQATGVRLGQAMEAAASVVSARGETIRDAASSPLSADLGELNRMVPEKIAAFSQSGDIIMRACLEAQQAWWSQSQAIGSMMMRGRPATPGETLDFFSMLAGNSVRAIEAVSRTGRDALAPVHVTVTGNAARLRRKGRNRLAR